MNLARKKELMEEKVKAFTKKYLGIQLDIITVGVVAMMVFVILALFVFDIFEF